MVFVMLNTSLEFASHGSILAKFSVEINPAEIKFSSDRNHDIKRTV
jgi:hypothetical protein